MTLTRAEIATALGCTPQAVAQRLEAIKPTAQKQVHGNTAQAFHFAALPADMQSALAAAARAQGFGDSSATDFEAVRALFNAAAPVWQHPIGWHQAPPQAREIASQRRNVFEPILRGLELDTRSASERESAGVAEYSRVFGHAITPRGFRKLMAQIIERDGGREDWMNLELYLPENLKRPSAPPRNRVKSKRDLSGLAIRLVFHNPAKPTLAERQNVLEYSFRLYDELAATAPHQRHDIKRDILTLLDGAKLAASPAALKRNWNRKYDRWNKHGQTPAAVADGRAVPSDQPWMAELQPDLELILKEAFNHDGKLALAIRKLRREGKLSQKFVDRYTLDVRRAKSYVAKSIRREINARLTGLLAYRQSAWKVNMAGPRLPRDHNYDPGDYFAADDVTFNIVFWYIGEDGLPAVTRGEVLLFFDCRSLYPLGYVLVYGRYNGETIRRGILNVHDKHGLPHRAFIFEKGIWASRLMEGSRPRDFLGWDEYEMGLRERGLSLEIRHATTPQGKLIEGIFNILQQNQRGERGFVGFNERDYGQEKLQTFIGRVKRGLVHPSTEFHSDVEWRDALDRSLETYMHEPQNGKMLPGISPAEMFAQHRPLRKLPDEARYLMASHRVRAKVKSDGLTITIRGQRRSFYSKELAPHHGREVFAWFNIEQPDLLTVSTLDRKTFFSLKRHVLPAFDATDEQLKEANRARFGFMQAPKLLFDQIKHPTRRAITNDNIVDDNAKALGAHIRLETEQHQAEQSEEKRLAARLIRAADAARILLPENISKPRSFLRSLEMEAAAEASPSPIRPHQSEGDTQKTYTLNTDPAPDSTVKQYFATWARLEKAMPGLDRHALTQKHLGGHPTPYQMTTEQRATMIGVFSAILRDFKKEKVTT